MRLPDYVHDAIRRERVTVYYAPREMTKLWNRQRDEDDLISFGGWYWHRSDHANRVIEVDQFGPFRSEQAAIRDAYKSLQLRSYKKK